MYRDLRNRIAALEKKSKPPEKSTYTGGLRAYAYVDLPTNGLGNGSTYVTMVFVSDGRKDGEGAGNGTGCVAIYDSAAADWLRTSDYSSVAI